METVHIALASNQNYFCGLLTTAGSIACHASKDVKLMFHILDGGINDLSFSDMETKIGKLHPHTSFHRISVDENLFRNYPEWAGNRMAYARLMLPDALPDITHIVYSDVDFLWLIDIAELWAMRSDDATLLGVRDGLYTIASEEKWAKIHNLPFDPERYFCSGMSLYNLERFRNEKVIEQIVSFLDKYPDVQFPDQFALNHILRDDVVLLPKKWQVFSTELTQEMLNGPLAIHYAGDAPWNRGKFWIYSISDSTRLWYAMFDHINGVTSGSSIKSHLNLWQRIYKRFLADINRHSITRKAFKLLLRSSGRSSYIKNFNTFAIDLCLTQKKIRKLVLPQNTAYK